jgi:HK97 gp10 family phage protein
MASPVRFEMKGLRQLGANFKELDDVMQRKIAASATGAAAKVVKEAAKQIVTANPSVDTGSLGASIISKKLGKRAAGGFTSAHIVTPRHKRSKKGKNRAKQQVAPHAIFVEYGTVNMPAEPFLRPALERNIGKASNTMRDRIATGIEKAAQRLKK